MLRNGARLLPHDRQRKWHYLGGLRVARVACGAKHTVAVTDDGEIFAWGANECGQLGAPADWRVAGPEAEGKQKQTTAPRRASGGAISTAAAAVADAVREALPLPPSRLPQRLHVYDAARNACEPFAVSRAYTLVPQGLASRTVVWRRGGGGNGEV